MDPLKLLDWIWTYLGVSGYVIVFSLVISLLDWMTEGLLSGLFAYNVRRVLMHGEIHRFFLCPFLHGSLGHFQGNMVIFAIFGPLIEKRVGVDDYLLLFFIGHIGSVVVSSLIEVWYDSLSIGLSGVIYAFQAAYLMLIFIQPTSLWDKIVGYIGFLWIIQDLWRSFWAGVRRGRYDNIDHWGHLGGILAGIFYVRFFM